MRLHRWSNFHLTLEHQHIIGDFDQILLPNFDSALTLAVKQVLKRKEKCSRIDLRMLNLFLKLCNQIVFVLFLRASQLNMLINLVDVCLVSINSIRLLTDLKLKLVNFQLVFGL